MPRVLLLATCLVAAVPVVSDAGPPVASATAPAPDTFTCPMHCEGSKHYEAPRSCPVCGMALSLVDGARYQVTVTPLTGPIRPGEPTTLGFAIRDPQGKPVRKLEVVHEKILHLLVTSADLSWFAHEHPERNAKGDLELRMTFPAPGRYTLFHDFTPPRVGMQVVPVELTVEGTPPPAVPLVVDEHDAKTIDGVTARLASSGPLLAEQNLDLVVSLARGDTPVTDLEPFLGAMGHLIIVSADLERFVHSHPVEHRHRPSERGPDIRFQARFPAGGTYKAWAQFQHAGKLLTVPFTLEVAASDHSH
jgi:hypothetical protein